jgi:nickel/cobalt transporter (NicO) family protein
MRTDTSTITTRTDIGMPEQLFFPLAIAAVTLASLHALAPDHWAPIAALGRAQGWSTARTARITAMCGLSHVTTSVVLGLVGLAFGIRVFERFGAQLESVAGFILIAFGIGYGVWGLRHAAAHVHGHHHHHYDHVHEPGRARTWTLFVVYAADPCIAIVPLMFAAASLGWAAVVGIVLLYEAATILTMTGLVLPARSAANSFVRGQWMHRYGDAVAGAFIALIGVTVALLGW